MSHVIPISKVNQFLPKNKLSLDDEIDGSTGLPMQHDWIADLEETARDIVLGQLSVMYDTVSWFTPIEIGETELVNTPPLVVSIAGMLVAGWLYDRQFSEEVTTGASYGTRKVREAYSLLNGILDGTYSVGLEVIPDPSKLPSTLITEPVFIMEERY